MIKKDFFDLTEEIYSTKKEKKILENEINQYDTAISVVCRFVPSIETTLNVDEFSKIQEELKNDILKLHQDQEIIFEELSSAKADKAHLQSQLIIAKTAVSDLQKDYEFTESSDEEIECPTCGTIHDNSLVSRFSLLKDKEQAEQIVQRLSKDYKKSEKEVDNKEFDLSKIREKISALNNKYYQSDKGENISLQNILDSVAAHSVKNKVEVYRDSKEKEHHDLDSKEKELVKIRVKESKTARKSVKERFSDTVSKLYIKTKSIWYRFRKN